MVWQTVSLEWGIVTEPHNKSSGMTANHVVYQLLSHSFQFRLIDFMKNATRFIRNEETYLRARIQWQHELACIWPVNYHLWR